MKYLVGLAVAAALFTITSAVYADSLSTRAHQRGAITHIDEGVFQLGVDSTFLLNWDRANDETVSRSAITGSGMLRYFVQPAIGVSGRFGGLYRRSGDTRDLGFSALGWGNYFMRLGEGMFFAPGAGAGVVIGQRDIPGIDGQVSRESLFGGVVAAELMASMFLSRRFSLNAGPEFSLMVGNAGDTFTTVNGSFKVGAAYAF